MKVKAVVVIDTMISSGKSGIPTAGSAIPTSSESRLIDSEVMSRPAPRVASKSSSDRQSLLNSLTLFNHLLTV